MSIATPQSSQVRTLASADLGGRDADWESFLARRTPLPLSYHPRWLVAMERGLGHTPFCLEAIDDGRLRGLLPLSFLHTRLFGRFLVSLPYLNYGGVVADDEEVAGRLVERAVTLADERDVRYLEVRHERAIEHPPLTRGTVRKVHLRKDLPATAGVLWSDLKASVRNQVRKGQKNGLSVAWGGAELIDEFYSVFRVNMRDLGTPVYGRRLFAQIIETFPRRAEFCVVRDGTRPLAAALLVHGWGVTEVPSASSLRRFNHTSANMMMYWHLLERAVERGQSCFDFGRSTPDTPTYRFKTQWGATSRPADWQYYVRRGSVSAMRPDSKRFQRVIQVWKRLPVGLASFAGPTIVRGIP